MSPVRGRDEQIPRRAIWRSRYSFDSTSRGRITVVHHLLVRRWRGRVIGRSLDSPDGSRVALHLVRAGRVLTGTWTEHTAPAGHYSGAVYHGALQLVLDQDVRRATGLWVGYDKALVVDGGRWELELKTRDTSRASRRRLSGGSTYGD